MDTGEPMPGMAPQEVVKPKPQQNVGGEIAPDSTTPKVEPLTSGALNDLRKRSIIENEAKKEASPTDRARKAIEKIQEERRETHGKEILPTTGISGDSDSIEGQQIDFVSQQENFIAVYFKLTPKALEIIQANVIPSMDPKEAQDGQYVFRDVQGREITMSDARIIQIDENTIVRLSTGRVPKMEVNEEDRFRSIKENDPIPSLKGAVTIEVKGLSDAGDIVQRVETAFTKLGVVNALNSPDDQAQVRYKENRIRWQHRLDDEDNWLSFRTQYKERYGVEPNERLEYQEVFPGYFTIVDTGASEIYQREGPLFLIHTSNGVGIESILTNGLLSRHERYKRGMDQKGIATTRDFYYGGADSVFLGCFPDQGSLNEVLRRSSYTFIIKPEILDRTDWYAYNQAEFGNTEGTTFNTRPSPDKFLKSLRENPILSNEVMMRRGVPPQMLENLVVRNEKAKKQIIQALTSRGITAIDGKPLEEFVLTEDSFRDKVETRTTNVPKAETEKHSSLS